MWTEGGGGGTRGPPHPTRTHLPAPLWPLLWSSLAEDFVQGPQRSAVRAEQGAAVSSGSHEEEEKQSCKWSGTKERLWPLESGRPWNRSSSARESCVSFCPNPGALGHCPGLSARMPSPGARQWLWQKLGVCLGSSVLRAGQEHGLRPRLSLSSTGGGSQGSGCGQ